MKKQTAVRGCRRGRLVRVSAIMVAVGSVGASALYARVLARQDDDMTSLLRAYSSALHEFEQGNPDEQARVQFYRHWLSIVFGACEQLPPDAVPESARLACLALANGAGDYDLAEVIATDGSQIAPELRDRVTYWDQRVGLREVIAGRTGNSQDHDAVVFVASEAIDVLRPSLDDALFTRDASSFLNVQRVFQVAARAAASAANPSGAAEYMEESAVFAMSVPDAISHQVAFSWWADQCLQHAARYWIEAGNEPAAIQALRKIDSVSVKRAPSGEHALICAGDAVPLGNFREDFARAWLDQAEPWTDAEVRLAYALGFVLTHASPRPTVAQLQEAAGLLERILAMKAELASADTAASGGIQPGDDEADWLAEPVRSNTLVCLALTYKKLHLDDDAAVIAGMVVIDYPEHPSAAAMELMLE